LAATDIDPSILPIEGLNGYLGSMDNLSTVLFDLDGTLLAMDQERFAAIYFSEMSKHFSAVIDPKRLVDLIWAATGRMVANLEHRTNQEVFWEAFVELSGGSPGLEEWRFREFYADGYKKSREATASREAMRGAVGVLKEKGYRLVLATNPLFPREAIQDRIEWAGLDRDDFVHVSSFEDDHYCKPQPAYFREILDRLALDPAECLMVGNDAREDLVAGTLGVKTWLVTDDLVGEVRDGLQPDRRGTAAEFLAFAESLGPALS
jgi:HAD superfamily hydrolase (TIGR01549 family)